MSCPRCDGVGLESAERLQLGRAYSVVRFCGCPTGQRREVCWWAGSVRAARVDCPDVTPRTHGPLRAYCDQYAGRWAWLPDAVEEQLSTVSWRPQEVTSGTRDSLG